MQFCSKLSRILLLLLCFDISESMFQRTTSITISSILFTPIISFPLRPRIHTRIGRDDIHRTDTDLPVTRSSDTPVFYKFASRLLDWAFSDLDESEEDADNLYSGRDDKDRSVSSEEDDVETLLEELKKVKSKKRKNSGKQKLSGKGRRGTVRSPPLHKKNGSSKQTTPFKAIETEYDENIEKASLPELKQMLNKMKAEEEGLFGSKIFKNPFSGSIVSLGTNIFLKMYCGFSSSNPNCNSATPSRVDRNYAYHHRS